MKYLKKYLPALVFCLPLAAFCLSVPAAAQMNYYNADKMEAEAQIPAEESVEKARSFTVTSIQKCYALLSREEVLEIQQNYIKPYQECQKRVADNLKKKQGEKKAADAKEKASSEARHGGFYRVQKEAKPLPEPEAPEDKNPPPRIRDFEEKVNP